MKSKNLAWVLAVSLVLNVITGYLLVFGQNRVNSDAKDDQPEEYSLLSKRLFVQRNNDVFINFSPLRTQIKKYLKDTDIPHSFYLEYLPSGTSIRSGDSDEFVGASLMKLPVIMDLYKSAEMGKLKLSDEVIIDDKAISNKYGLLYQSGVGSKITLERAVELAITESDNTAARLILEQTEKAIDPRERSLNFLDAEIKADMDAEQPLIHISARSYSSFMKCLYLACYLNMEDSQAVLSKLTETDFHNRIEAGVPDKSIKIAHKIGSYSKKVSSDCGIVYLPKRPYLFCLMINSTDANADKIIANVSSMAYEYISNVKTFQ